MQAARRSTVSSGRQRLLAERARALREFPTVSERKPWLALSGGQLGVSFRRQVPLLGRFIADFFAPPLRLVVEVDGSVHERTRRADARRDEKLARLGYHVLRLDAELVLRDLPAAVARLREAVEGLRP
jgi:very-short-patch-repair endonuclease